VREIVVLAEKKGADQKLHSTKTISVVKGGIPEGTKAGNATLRRTKKGGVEPGNYTKFNPFRHETSADQAKKRRTANM